MGYLVDYIKDNIEFVDFKGSWSTKYGSYGYFPQERWNYGQTYVLMDGGAGRWTDGRQNDVQKD